MTQTDNDRRRSEAIAWMLRLTPGTATREDIAAFEDWRRRDPAHAKAFVEVRELWRAVGPAGRALFDPRALETFAAPRLAGAALGRRAFLGAAMAASAAAAAYVAVRPPLDLWPSLAELSADYRTAVGEQRQVALAAGATIVMNTRTSLALRPDVDDVARIELIAGEGVLSTGAYPLEVVAGDGRARGVGTTFDIRRDGGEVSVTCLDGEVSVVCGASSSTLAGGHRVSYSNGRLGPVSAVEPALAASWREGFLVFRDTRLDEVVAEINRYRRGRIVLVGEALGRKTVNGRFYLSRLDDAVEKLRNAFGAHVTSLPGGVMILS